MVFGCYDNINKPKRYIQFNDLVFSGRKSIDEQSESISLREFKTARTFWHGSYVGNRGDISLIDSNSISLTIALPTTHWNDEHVKAHYGFIMKWSRNLKASLNKLSKAKISGLVHTYSPYRKGAGNLQKLANFPKRRARKFQNVCLSMKNEPNLD